MHAANALDLLGHSPGKLVVKNFCTFASELDPLVQVRLGQRYRLDDVLKGGAMRLLQNLPKDMSTVPTVCFQLWQSTLLTAQKTRVALQAYLRTRDPDVRTNVVKTEHYTANASYFLDQIRNKFGLTLFGDEIEEEEEEEE
jgi:hypothetical protein